MLMSLGACIKGWNPEDRQCLRKPDGCLNLRMQRMLILLSLKVLINTRSIGHMVPMPINLVFMSTFNDQCMIIGWVSKLGHQSGSF